MANDLNSFYSSHYFTAEQELVYKEISSMKCADIDISIEDVKSYFRHVNPCKASGPDGISSRTLRVCAHHVGTALAKAIPAVNRHWCSSLTMEKNL